MNRPQSIFLKRLLDRVQSEVEPGRLLRPYLSGLDARGELLVVGAGKAAAPMVRAFAEAAPRARGVAVTVEGLGGRWGGIEVVEAGHPIPSEASVVAARRILGLCAAAAPQDHVFFLLSGGASALMALPAPGVSLQEKMHLTSQLLASGADIHEINTVRRHLSAIKGGRLSAATRASMTTFALSDVPGDDPLAIGSGPTVIDPSTLADAWRVLRRHRISVAPAIARALDDPANETLKSEPAGRARSFQLVGGPQTAIAAGRRAALDEGYEVIVLGSESGEAREIAARHVELARACARQGRRVALVSGGELSVSLGGARTEGGRCREYLLAVCAAAGPRAPWLSAAAWDTDGVDGSGEDAGAVLFGDTYERATALGVNPEKSLSVHASGEFFERLGDAVRIGPTGTNVGDFRILLTDPLNRGASS
jgi:hydroxypyruvate reductase